MRQWRIEEPITRSARGAGLWCLSQSPAEDGGLSIIRHIVPPTGRADQVIGPYECPALYWDMGRTTVAALRAIWKEAVHHRLTCRCRSPDRPAAQGAGTLNQASAEDGPKAFPRPQRGGRWPNVVRSDEGVSLQLFRNTKRNEKTCVRACKTNGQDARQLSIQQALSS